MSSASSDRSASGARWTWLSTSGRWPAFQASMNWLRMRSRSRVTENLLQSLHATAAARVKVVHGDADPVGDLVGRQPFEEGHREHLAVVVVLDVGDAPRQKVVCGSAALLVVGGLGVLGLAVERDASDRRVIGAGLIAGLVGVVEAAGGVLGVPELLA